MRRILARAAVLVLALTACEMNAELSVNPDGSGTMGFSFAMEESLLAAVPPGQDPFADLRSELAGDPVVWSFEEYTERGLRGIRATFPFSDVDDLKRTSALLAEGDGSRGAFGEGLRLERSGDGWVLDATGEAPDGGLGAPGTGGDPSLGVDPVDPLAGFAELFSISFRVTLPGSASETNATETIAAGGRTTFVWRVDASSTEAVVMRAHTVGAATGSVPYVPIGVGVLILGAAIMLVARTRRPLGPPPVVFEGMGSPEASQQDDELAV